MSRCRTNFHSESEAMINKQINMELYASYVYLSMVSTLASLTHMRPAPALQIYLCNIISSST